MPLTATTPDAGSYQSLTVINGHQRNPALTSYFTALLDARQALAHYRPAHRNEVTDALQRGNWLASLGDNAPWRGQKR